jgi:glycosyltransferase involved in cell wall biosynthesis
MTSGVYVVIPAFNEPIDRLLRTVQSATSLACVERVIVVDDGSTTREPEPLEGEGLTVLFLAENRGVAGAMNAGIALVPDGALVCRLEVGDVFLEAKGNQIADALATGRPSFSWYRDAVAGGVVRPPLGWHKGVYRDNQFAACTTVYPKAVWAEVGGYDDRLRYADDWDFAMKVQQAVGWAEHPDITGEAAQYPGGHTDQTRTDKAKRARRDAELVEVHERGRALSHPDLYAWRNRRPKRDRRSPWT